MSKRKKWIDSVRGISMLAIVLFHTEMYLVGNSLIDYNYYVENALVAFFVIAGYLFYKEDGFNIKRKLISIVRFLLVPYFIFTLIICVPKAYVHGELNNMDEILLDLVLGKASWFIAALIVSEFIFCILIFLSQRYYKLILPISCFICAVIAFLFPCDYLYTWFTNAALMSIVFLYIGYFYHAKEAKIDENFNIFVFICLVILLIVLKLLEDAQDQNMVMDPNIITSVSMFYCDTLASSFILIWVFKRIDRWQFRNCVKRNNALKPLWLIQKIGRFVNYVGRNSLVFYFLCGGVPLLVGMLFNHIGLSYHGNYLIVLLAFATSTFVISLASYVITNYLPFMIGKPYKEIRKRSSNFIQS